MTGRSVLENAFGLRWIQDDAKGRLIYAAGQGDYKSPAEAIKSLGLGCDEATFKESLDRFPPHLRIHGGYNTPDLGDAATFFSLTWEPGATEATYAQTVQDPDEGMEGTIEVPPDGNLKEVMKSLLVPDAQDIVSQAQEEGKKVTIENVDFWIGSDHFKVSGEDEA